jgi:hypothetical protein
MKFLKYFLPCSFLMILISCSPKIIPSAEVNYLGKGQQGTINVSSIGYGKKMGDIEEVKKNAEINAFNTLLFRGIPGTDLQNAMLGTNESEIKSKNSDYFKSFFNNNRYRTFIMSSNPTSSLFKEKGYNKITIVMKINIYSLRKDLEQNGVIRKFGF